MLKIRFTTINNRIFRRSLSLYIGLRRKITCNSSSGLSDGSIFYERLLEAINHDEIAKSFFGSKNHEYHINFFIQSSLVHLAMLKILV